MGQPPVGWSASRSVQIQSVYTVYVYVTPFSFVFQWGFVDGWPVGRSVVRHLRQQKASNQRLFNALLYDGSGGLSLSWSMSRLACLLVCPHPSTGQRKYRTDGKTVVTRIRTQWCIHFGAASVLSRLRRWCPSMSSPIYLNLEKPAFLSCRPFSSFRSQSSICNSRAQVDQQGVTSPTLTAGSYAMEHM